MRFSLRAERRYVFLYSWVEYGLRLRFYGLTLCFSGLSETDEVDEAICWRYILTGVLVSDRYESYTFRRASNCI